MGLTIGRQAELYYREHGRHNVGDGNKTRQVNHGVGEFFFSIGINGQQQYLATISLVAMNGGGQDCWNNENRRQLSGHLIWKVSKA